MDGIGFHAIGEMILTYAGMPVFPPLNYLSVSRNTNQLSSFFFKKRSDYPVPIAGEMLWDDDTNILWDNDTNIEWDG